MSSIRVIIVDDEDLARLNIVDSLKQYTDMAIVGEFESGDIPTHILNTLNADVVFIDIEMPHVNGIALAKHLLTLDNKPHIVFVTAYDNYAVQAFDLCAIDYLLKPFDSQRFAQTITRIRSSLQEKIINDNIQQLEHINKKKFLERLIIKTTGAINIVKIEDVIWLSSSGNYVEVHCTQTTYLHRVTLSFLEQHLDPDVFFRTHRTSIVKKNEIKEIRALDENKFSIILANGQSVQLSKRYRDALLLALT